MKVRKFLFVGALIAASLFSVNSVMAEDVVTPTRSKSASVTVNLKFQPIQSIVVKSGAEGVNLVYATEADYSKGKSVTVNDHLEIFSTGGFVVTVKADNNFTRTSTGGKETIDASDVKVTATKANGNTNDDGKGLPEVTLSSTEAKNFIASKTGGSALKFNVKYDNYGGAGNAYIDKYIHSDTDATGTVYAATVTYSIAAN